MQSFAALSMLLVGAVTLAVGVRLLVLAARTRKLPELAFGITFVAGSVGTALAQVGQRVLWADGSTVAGVLNALCFGLAVVGTLSLYVVVWRVFRPQGFAGAALCVLGSAAAAVAWGMRIGDGSFVVLNLQNSALVVFQLDRFVLFGWSSYEALRHASMLGRRLKVGLADPLAATQIWLWGISGLLMLPVTGAIIAFVAGYAAHPLDHTFTTTLVTILPLGATLLMWCAFFPPPAVRRLALRRLG